MEKKESTARQTPLALVGRGSVKNLPNRFEELYHGEREWQDEDGARSVPTQFLNDASRSIIATNDSPDVGFDASVNPYRGCEHGCIYCYARPTHEYLGFSCGLDFETKIMVKTEAPRLLREALSSASWNPTPIGMSGVTDCYQPIERTLMLTRGCLEVLNEFRNPAVVITKNALVLRDRDILKRMAEWNGALVYISITTLDTALCGKMEPRTSRPDARLRALSELARDGIPCGVLVSPVIPGLTDHELPKILERAKENGAQFAGYTPLRLPLGVRTLFLDWLDRHFPDRKSKIIAGIESIRSGNLNDANFGSRMRGTGPTAHLLNQMFKIYTQRYGLNRHRVPLSTEQFRRPGEQLSFFKVKA